MKQFANNMHETEKLQLQKTSQHQNLSVPHPVPTLEELLKLHQKPLPGATDLDVKLNNEAFIYFMEFVLPKIAGAKGWQEEMCSNPLSDMKITPSDEAFALLCCKNMWDKWNADDSTTTSHHDQGKYTSSGTNRKYGGWSEQGLRWFNELFREAVINRSKKWAPTIEGTVMDRLRKKYYPNASLDDIRKSKTRRKKYRRDLDGKEYELAQLPHAAWDPNLIVIQEGSSSSDKEQD